MLKNHENPHPHPHPHPNQDGVLKNLEFDFRAERRKLARHYELFQSADIAPPSSADAP